MHKLYIGVAQFLTGSFPTNLVQSQPHPKTLLRLSKEEKGIGIVWLRLLQSIALTFASVFFPCHCISTNTGTHLLHQETITLTSLSKFYFFRLHSLFNSLFETNITNSFVFRSSVLISSIPSVKIVRIERTSKCVSEGKT